jgi:carotenoid cleavage dioxygenase-like enzyme
VTEATIEGIRDAAANASVGFQSLESEAQVDRLPVEGELPAWLDGALLRTGPALYDAAGRTVEHWFDGMSMLHRFGFAGGQVSYANRFLDSRAYRGFREDGRIHYREFASDPCRTMFRRVASMFAPDGELTDNAHGNLARVADRFIALTETPLPVAFDPETLDTLGVVDYPDAMKGQLTTAHPHRHPGTGELVSYMTLFGPRSRYQLYALGDLGKGRRKIASIPVQEPSYMHSFAVTERFAVFVEYPFVVNPLKLALSRKPFIQSYRWRPRRGTRFTAVELDTGKVRRRWQGPASFALHHVNAFEDGDELAVDLLGYDDPGLLDSFTMDRRRAAEPPPDAELRRHRLPLSGGEVRVERLTDTPFEIPGIDAARRDGRAYDYAYGVSRGDSDFWAEVVKVDVRDGSTLRWSEPGCYAGEPVFVPSPDAREEDDGILLSVVLDAAARRSFALALDARTLAERARAWVPHGIPIGFHGQFVPS